MKTALIVAEFNPYHNGHKYIAEKARELTGADYIIALMSGDYVQRGAPAIVDRYTRAGMALSSGIDLVIALPTRYSACSAEEYAGHSLRIADSLGCVDYLFFGSECGDIDRLSGAARVLAYEPDDYKERLRDHLRQGVSFPKARALALPQFEDLLGAPNNILGIEYIKAILRGNYAIQPKTCRRIGVTHDSSDLSGAYASATAIREMLAGHGQRNRDSLAISRLSSYIPARAYELLKVQYENNRLVYEDDLTFMLASALWEANSPEELTKYLSVSDTLANAIWSLRDKCLSFTGFAMLLKNRSLTYTHVARALLHIALRIKKDSTYDFAHILGMRKEAGALVSRMIESSRIPVIMRPSRELADLDVGVRSLFDEEIRLSNLYNILTSQRCGQDIQNEMSRRLITM